MKNILKLLFVSIGSWKLKYSNDPNAYYFLDTKEKNNIEFKSRIPWNTYSFIYDESKELLTSNTKNIKCSIIEDSNSLSYINHETNNYSIYEKIKEKNTNKVGLNIILLSLLLVDIYQMLMQHDTLTILVRNIINGNNRL